MSNEQSTSSKVYYDGTYKTALSNYIITVTGGGQILVSDVNDWNKFVGIKPPTESDVWANTRQLMLVYTKPVTGDAFDTANYSWISTDAGMIKFTKAWQLLTATREGNFNYIDPPTENETFYLKYVPSAGIQWTTVVNSLPFVPNVKSQIIGYDATENKAVNVTGNRANYVLTTTNFNNTGLQFGYVTPATLNLNYQVIEGTAVVMARNNNTFSLEKMYPFSQDLKDGEIIFLDITDPQNPFFNGIKSTTSQFHMLYTHENENGKMRWKYDYFRQEVAGLGSDIEETQDELAVWDEGRLIARSVEEIMGEIDNYYQWGGVLQSCKWLCGSDEQLDPEINDNYSTTIVIRNEDGVVLQNRFFSYSGNLEMRLNLTLHIGNLRWFEVDDDDLYGINISMKFTECTSMSEIIEDGLEGTLSICNIPITNSSSPFFKISEFIITPFFFSHIPQTDETKNIMFLPTETIISSINNPDYDIVYKQVQSKYKIKLATGNIKQHISCKKLYIFKQY